MKHLKHSAWWVAMTLLLTMTISSCSDKQVQKKEIEPEPETPVTPPETKPSLKPFTYNAAFFEKLQKNRETSSAAMTWTNFGPAMSGYCDELWIHPTDPDWMYTTLDMGNCYYTANAGLQWMTVLDYDGTATPSRISWVDFSRQDPTFGLAFTEKGKLMRTSNQGKTFTMDTSGKFPSERKQSVIAVDPNDDKNWYVGAGQFWRVKFMHRSINNLYGTNPDTQYRNTEYGHVILSKDKGESWTKISEPFPDDLDVARIFVDPRDGQTIYLFANHGFYKSTDGGYNWTRTGAGLPHNQPRDGAMCYDKASGKLHLYLLEQTHYEDAGTTVTCTGGLYHSTDGGENWEDITSNLYIDMTKINNYSVKEQYWRTLGYWFEIGTNAAKSKYPDRSDNILSVFNRVVVNPNNPDEIYVSNNVKHDYSFGPAEMWRSMDGGAHWEVCARAGSYWTNQEDAAYWRDERSNPMGKNMTYAHLDRYMTEDNVWVGVRFLTANTRDELICVHEQQVLRSTDHGDSWHQIDDIESEKDSDVWIGQGNSNLPGEWLQLDTHMNRYLFCSGEHGLWVNENIDPIKYPGKVGVRQLSGQSISQYDATSVSAVAVHPNDSNKIYMLMFRQGDRGHFRATEDGGKTWKNLSEPVKYDSSSQEHCHQHDILIDPTNPQRMYFCVPQTVYNNHTSTMWKSNMPKTLNEHGVFRTDDSGHSWHLANTGIPSDKSVLRLTMDLEDTNTIYASCSAREDGTTGGLYRTTNGGSTWVAMDIPEGIESVNELYIDRTYGTLYLSAGQYTGDTKKGGAWRSQDKGKTWVKIFEMPYVRGCSTSPLDPNIILVNCALGKKVGRLNPGVYMSSDNGSTWTKYNVDLGQPERINALRCDRFNKNTVWCALYGSGWYKGVLRETAP